MKYKVWVGIEEEGEYADNDIGEPTKLVTLESLEAAKGFIDALEETEPVKIARGQEEMREAKAEGKQT